MVGAGVGGFGVRRDRPEGLLESIGGVRAIGSGCAVGEAFGAGAEAVIKAISSIEGVIEHGGVGAAADVRLYAEIVIGVCVVICYVVIDAHEAGEEVGIVGAVPGGAADGVGFAIGEVEDAAVEVVLAGLGAGVVASIGGVGEQHLRVWVIAGGAGIYGGLVAIDAVRQEVLDLIVDIKIMAEDVIGDGDGDGGVSLAVGCAGFKLGGREEAMLEQGEGRDDVDEVGGGDGLGVGVDGEVVD